MGLIGPQGPIGPKGDKGDKGETGLRGLQGEPGSVNYSTDPDFKNWLNAHMKGITLYCANGECVLPSGYSRIRMVDTYVGVNSDNKLYTSGVGIGSTYIIDSSSIYSGNSGNSENSNSNTNTTSNALTTNLTTENTSSINLTENTTSVNPIASLWETYTNGVNPLNEICKVDNKIGYIDLNNPSLGCYYSDLVSTNSAPSTNYQYLTVNKDLLQNTDSSTSGSLSSFNICKPVTDNLGTNYQNTNVYGYVDNGVCHFNNTIMNLQSSDFKYVDLNTNQNL